MDNIIKIGGCYKTKDGEWLIVNKKYRLEELLNNQL